MSLDQQLREVLTEQAERFEAAPPDFDAMMAGGLVLRRRRRVVAAVSAFVILAILAAGIVAGRDLWDTRADEPVDWPKPEFTSTRVPWCVPDPAHPRGREFIVGAGPPVRTWCTYHNTGHLGQDGWLWHHAGSTILTRRPGAVFRVADGRLTRLGTANTTTGIVKLSHDGRYVAWTDGCQLNVYEVATATELAATTVPAAPGMRCDVDGIDDLGRVYVELSALSDLSSEVPWEFEEVQMYDLRTGEWAQVVGLPASTPPWLGLAVRYVTADGFAAYQDEYVSVEGVVEDDGRFVPQREVPVGYGLWSPDHSLFVEQRNGDVVVRPATDLTSGQILDLPIESYAPEGPPLAVQWESPSSVLVAGNEAYGERVGYRCDIRSGTCQVLNRVGSMAGANSHQGHGLGG